MRGRVWLLVVLALFLGTDETAKICSMFCGVKSKGLNFSEKLYDKAIPHFSFLVPEQQRGIPYKSFSVSLLCM